MRRSVAHAGILSRREVLRASTGGFGLLAFTGLAHSASPSPQAETGPLAPRKPHFAPRALRVISMFMNGGPSQYETLEYRPELVNAGDKSAEAVFNGRRVAGKMLSARCRFRPAGESGVMLSELLPNVAQHADKLCVLNGMHTDSPAHPQATIMMHTGSINFVRPSVGSWLVYGLGSENENLPGFVTINPIAPGGAQNYGSAFLPASYQGTRIGSAQTMANIESQRGMTRRQQRQQLEFIQQLNRNMSQRIPGETEIDGVIQSYELAFRMQTAVPEVLDIATESAATRTRYGIDESATRDFGTQCLMARRLAVAGVRYIEINKTGWDQHNNLTERITQNCMAIDRPVAALLEDLAELGMLDDTLILWGGEFGRTPLGQNDDGRRHNNRGFSMFLAGGGVRGGMSWGRTDPVTGVAVEGQIHVHDLHATILHLMGLDHTRLTFRYAGRDFRLTDVHGRVVEEILV